jgi:hypothetical protein
MKAENTTKTLCKVFFAWQDEKEEKWLEEMAASGWFLDKVAPYLYTFINGTPKRVVYRLDFKYTLASDYEDYLNLFKDTGWQLVGGFANWHYFSFTPETESVPEVFNSNRSKAEKYRRILYLLLFLGLLIVSPLFRLFDFSSYTPFDIGMLITKGLYALVVILYIYCIIRVLIKIRQLESKSRE